MLSRQASSTGDTWWPRLELGLRQADKRDSTRPGEHMSDESPTLTWALHDGNWLPCRVLEEDPQTGTHEVRVTDRSGTHEVPLHPEDVRGYVRGSASGPRRR